MIRMWSRHSRRSVPMNRSAIAFARGARTGVRMIRMSAPVKTASKAAVNLLSRSRIRNRNRSPRSLRSMRAARVLDYLIACSELLQTILALHEQAMQRWQVGAVFGEPCHVTRLERAASPDSPRSDPLEEPSDRQAYPADSPFQMSTASARSPAGLRSHTTTYFTTRLFVSPPSGWIVMVARPTSCSTSPEPASRSVFVYLHVLGVKCISTNIKARRRMSAPSR